LGNVERKLYGNDELHLHEEMGCAWRGICIWRKNCTERKTWTGRTRTMMVSCNGEGRTSYMR
jgi:hypothetical protein